MRYLNVILSLIIITLFASCTQKATAPLGPPIGLLRLSLEDPERLNWDKTHPRPLITSIWYPAEHGSKMEEIGIPPKRPVFIGGYAARKANLAQASKTYPLIIMSHGTGGAGMQMMWIGRELAAQGYIVAATDHHGNTAAENKFDPRGFRMPWERAKDMTVVLNLLLDDPEWGSRIDENNIGAVGFSLGGYTVTALAGGRLDFDKFKEFCESPRKDATCEEQSEYPEAGTAFDNMLRSNPMLTRQMDEHKNDYRDPRIRAVVALAPALGQALTEESLSEIDIPYITIVGDDDPIAPTATNANHLAKHITNAQIHILGKSNHYVFLNRCNKRGLKYVPLCKEPADAPKAVAHQETIKLVTKFFGQHLGN